MLRCVFISEKHMGAGNIFHATLRDVTELDARIEQNSFAQRQQLECGLLHGIQHFLNALKTSNQCKRLSLQDWLTKD